MPTDDDFDDDRPARRPRNSRDDDDAPPARRRRDDDDDVPRRSGGAPHRGTLVLVLGILGLCCGICGLIAFILGLVDMGKMNKGEMDPSGKGMTMAGTIIGIIGFVLNCATGIYMRTNPNAFGQ